MPPLKVMRASVPEQRSWSEERQFHMANLPQKSSNLSSIFLSQKSSGTCFDFFSSPLPCVLRQVKPVALSAGPAPLHHPPSQSTHSFWLQRNTLKLCLRTGRNWKFQHLNVLHANDLSLLFVLCPLASHLSSVPRIDLGLPQKNISRKLLQHFNNGKFL